jgi:hypothetical protein
LTHRPEADWEEEWETHQEVEAGPEAEVREVGAASCGVLSAAVPEFGVAEAADQVLAAGLARCDLVRLMLTNTAKAYSMEV